MEAMKCWNMFDPEIAEERRLLRDYGGSTGAPRHADSYKAQAKRELARRLNLEQDIQDLQQELHKAIDRYEAAEEALQCDTLSGM
jgi:transposase